MQVLTTDNLFTGEKMRGAVAGAFTGTSVFGLNLLGVSSMGLSAPVSSFIFIYMLGSFAGYVVDILFAKKSFIPVGSNAIAPVPIPYRDLATRAHWLFVSLTQRYFFRFVVTIIIETLTGLAMLEAVISYLDREKYLKEWKLRNALVAIGVAIVNFTLFVNILRFDWAYQEVEHPVLDIVVLMWMVLTLLVFAVTQNRSHVSCLEKSSQKQSDEYMTG